MTLDASHEAGSVHDLESIQDAIVDRLHAGEAIDRAALLAAHPEHAEALQGFFRVLDLVEHGPPPATAPARLGEFTILREIGRGGMGVVYEAEQRNLRRRVALKVLPPALGRDGRLQARFQREAEAAARLRHPHIVPVYSYGDVAGTPFFAMELVDGRPLSEILAEQRAGRDAGVPAGGEARRRFAVELVAKLADALAYAHANGIVHRDVKPSNVIVEKDGTPRLTDFGLAQDLGAEALTLSGEVCGSPRYMSPEQAFRRQKPIDHRTDVYSLGVTLYEMLTLALPYAGATSVEYTAELSKGAVIPPRRFDASIPEALERVLMRALALEPEDRYADASLFAEDLRAALEGRPVAAPAPMATPVPENAAVTGGAGAARRRKRWWIAAGIAFVAIGGTATAIAILRDQARVEAVQRALASELGVHALFDRPLSARDWLLLGRRPTALATRQLQQQVRPDVGLRQAHERARPGALTCAVVLPGGLPEDAQVVLEASWEVEVAGKRVPVGTASTTSAQPGERTLIVLTPLASVLGPLENPSTLELEVRGHVSARARDSGVAFASFDVVEAHTLLLYDELPESYPKPRSSAEIDAAMKRALSPQAARFAGVTEAPDGGKALELELELAPGEGPVTGAGRLTARLATSAQAFGTARFVRETRAPDATMELATGRTVVVLAPGALVLAPHTVRVAFRMEPMSAADELALLAELREGGGKRLRLRFESARDVALGDSDCESYWAGSFEVDVPLQAAR